MTLEDAIKHCEEIACNNSKCALEHKQLAEWLKELKMRKALDYLPEANEDLEEEIENWMKRYVVGKDLRIINNDGADITPSDISQIARHFAEWQKHKMMKDAVESDIFREIKSPSNIEFQLRSKRFKMEGIKLGDKVKIIIVKEE